MATKRIARSNQNWTNSLFIKDPIPVISTQPTSTFSKGHLISNILNNNNNEKVEAMESNRPSIIVGPKQLTDPKPQPVPRIVKPRRRRPKRPSSHSFCNGNVTRKRSYSTLSAQDQVPRIADVDGDDTQPMAMGVRNFPPVPVFGASLPLVKEEQYQSIYSHFLKPSLPVGPSAISSSLPTPFFYPPALPPIPAPMPPYGQHILSNSPSEAALEHIMAFNNLMKIVQLQELMKMQMLPNQC